MAPTASGIYNTKDKDYPGTLWRTIARRLSWDTSELENVLQGKQVRTIVTRWAIVVRPANWSIVYKDFFDSIREDFHTRSSEDEKVAISAWAARSIGERLARAHFTVFGFVSDPNFEDSGIRLLWNIRTDIQRNGAQSWCQQKIIMSDATVNDDEKQAGPSTATQNTFLTPKKDYDTPPYGDGGKKRAKHQSSTPNKKPRRQAVLVIDSGSDDEEPAETIPSSAKGELLTVHLPENYHEAVKEFASAMRSAELERVTFQKRVKALEEANNDMIRKQKTLVEENQILLTEQQTIIAYHELTEKRLREMILREHGKDPQTGKAMVDLSGDEPHPQQEPSSGDRHDTRVEDSVQQDDDSLFVGPANDGMTSENAADVQVKDPEAQDSAGEVSKGLIEDTDKMDVDEPRVEAATATNGTETEPLEQAQENAILHGEVFAKSETEQTETTHEMKQETVEGADNALVNERGDEMAQKGHKLHKEVQGSQGQGEITDMNSGTLQTENTKAVSTITGLAMWRKF